MILTFLASSVCPNMIRIVKLSHGITIFKYVLVTDGFSSATLDCRTESFAIRRHRHLGNIEDIEIESLSEKEIERYSV